MHRKWTMAVVTALAFLLAPSAALAGDPLTSGVTSVTQPLPADPVVQVTQTAAAATGTVNVNASALNGNSVGGDGGSTEQTVKNDSATEAGNSASTKGSSASKVKQHAAAVTRTANVNASALNGNSVKGDGGATTQRISNHTTTKAANWSQQKDGKAEHKVKRHAHETGLPKLDKPELPNHELPKPDLQLPELGLPEKAPSACSMGDWLKQH